MLHGGVDEGAEVFERGCVGGYHHRAALLRELVDRSEPYGDRRVGEHELRTFFMSLQRGLPCDGLVVEGSEDYAFLAFE